MATISSPILRKGLQNLCVIQPFWGALALHMEFVRDDSERNPTLRTDGKRIYYNHTFCQTLTPGFASFVLAHEVSHPMLQHLSRPFKPNPKDQRTYGKTKNGKVWHYHPDIYNCAGDRVINLMLKDSGFQIWPKSLIDKSDRGLTTEQVYDKLFQDTTFIEIDGQGEGTGTACSTQPADGSAGPDPTIGRDLDPSEGPASDFDPQEFTEIVVKAASIAKAQGKLPANVAEMIKEATEPQYPVYMLLERFVDSTIHDEDYSWRRPHRDFMSRGIILPSAYSERISHVVLVYDTSGSVPDADLARFHRVGGDIIRRLEPRKLTVVQCDAGISGVRHIEKRSDWPRTIKCKGRGGTSFVPPFDLVKREKWQPSCLVYLTDMYGDFPPRDPGFPTLWVSTTKESKAPFGTTIYFNG